MIVSKFMTPAAQVVTCTPSDTVETVLNLTLDNPSIGAVVVVGDMGIPVGIVTKTDLLLAFKRGQSLEKDLVDTVMSRKIEKIGQDESRDKAELHFEATKHHHAFVVDADQKWVGLVTVWDVALESAKDNRAWPWNRDSVSMFLKHQRQSPRTKKQVAKVPKHPAAEPHTFMDIAGANE